MNVEKKLLDKWLRIGYTTYKGGIKMKVFNLLIEEGLHFKVKKLALELNMTMHEFILTAIKEKLRKEDKKDA